MGVDAAARSRSASAPSMTDCARSSSSDASSRSRGERSLLKFNGCERRPCDLGLARERDHAPRRLGPSGRRKALHPRWWLVGDRTGSDAVGGRDQGHGRLARVQHQPPLGTVLGRRRRPAGALRHARRPPAHRGARRFLGRRARRRAGRHAGRRPHRGQLRTDSPAGRLAFHVAHGHRRRVAARRRRSRSRRARRSPSASKSNRPSWRARRWCHEHIRATLRPLLRGVRSRRHLQALARQDDHRGRRPPLLHDHDEPPPAAHQRLVRRARDACTARTSSSATSSTRWSSA